MIFKKLSIRAKLIVVFAMVVFIAGASGSIAISRLRHINNLYSQAIDTNADAISHALNIELSFKDIHSNLYKYIINFDDATALTNIRGENDRLFLVIETNGNEYSKTIGDSSDALVTTLPQITQYKNLSEQIHQLCVGGEVQQAEDLIEKQINPLAENINKNLSGYSNKLVNDLTDTRDETFKGLQGDILFFSLLNIFVLAFCVGAAFILSHLLIKPIKKLLAATNKIAKGDFDVDLTDDGKDEISKLTNNMAVVVYTLKELTNEITQMSNKLDKEGDIEARVDASRFEGAYRAAAAGINAAIDGLTGDTLEVITGLNNLSHGDFSFNIKRHIGKKAILNTIVDMLKQNLLGFTSDLTEILIAAKNGDLEKRVESSKYEKQWKSLADDLNSLLEASSTPLNEAISVFSRLSKGEFTRVNGDYHGDYLVMKNSVNQTIETLTTYIHEISDTLTQMASQNFDLEIKNQYFGDFEPIKTALNKVIDNFNNVLSEINESSVHVASGAVLISQSAAILSSGAAMQSQETSNLVKQLSMISQNSHQAAESAKRADGLAKSTNEKAQAGNDEMKAMQKAMNQINDASGNIARIIKVIDDIAFQTNLLALNAAIEAARAGEHGRGFAVVAEEVRGLAASTQNAVRETTELINASLEQISKGTELANKTATALDVIVSGIGEISEAVSAAASSSMEQEESIATIRERIGRIAEVTNSNNATSQEEAAASEELSAQAQLFRETVSGFKLKKHSVSDNLLLYTGTSAPSKKTENISSATARTTADRAKAPSTTYQSNPDDLLLLRTETASPAAPVKTSNPTPMKASNMAPAKSAATIDFKPPVRPDTSTTASAKSVSATTPKPVTSTTIKPASVTPAKPAALTAPKPAGVTSPKPAATTTPKPITTTTPKTIATTTTTAPAKPVATSTPKPLTTTTTTTPAKPAATTTPKPLATATPVPPVKPLTPSTSPATQERAPRKTTPLSRPSLAVTKSLGGPDPSLEYEKKDFGKY